jgi:unsaturated rhamnogalacturonyl hydrolase
MKKTAYLLIISVILSGCDICCPLAKRDERTERIERVKSAMLAMQRYSWEQGVAAQALLEMGDEELVIQMAKEAVLRQRADGRLATVGVDYGVTDPACVGEAVLYAAKVTGDLELKKAADKMLNYLLNKAPKTKDGILHHRTDVPQVWIDSMYMAPPFLAAAGRSDEAVKQIEGFRKYLFDAEKKLYSHMWDEKKNDFARKDFWGVGNGWTAAGITRVIIALPAEMAEEKRTLISYVTELIDSCLVYMRPDGLFHDVIDNPDTFVETNLGQMLAYSIYRGLQHGWLDGSYRKHADKMRNAVIKKVDKFGLVQDVCGSPTFDRAGTATEGQAFFLLMETAYTDAQNK